MDAFTEDSEQSMAERLRRLEVRQERRERIRQEKLRRAHDKEWRALKAKHEKRHSEAIAASSEASVAPAAAAATTEDLLKSLTHIGMSRAGVAASESASDGGGLFARIEPPPSNQHPQLISASFESQV